MIAELALNNNHSLNKKCSHLFGFHIIHPIFVVLDG
jgi:hypothetical protein